MSERSIEQHTGRTIDVGHIISVGRDRKSGRAIVGVRDADGRVYALLLWKRQLRMLARGTSGLVEALDAER